MGSEKHYTYHLGLHVVPPSSAEPEAAQGLYCNDFNTSGDEVTKDELAKIEARLYHAALLREEMVVSGSIVVGTLYKDFEILEHFPSVIKE